jgi:hypothetical protein
MKRLLTILLLCAPSYGQTVNVTVVADTNRAIRTNFTIGNAQVAGLGSAATNPASAFQPANATLTNLSTNNGFALTNLTGSQVVGTVALASNITGILAISNGGTGSSSASDARTALGLGSAATNDTSDFQPASTNLTSLAGGDGSSLSNISATASLPTLISNAGRVLAVNTNETDVEWIEAAGGGGGSGTVTSVDASGGSTGMSFTGGPITTNGTLTLGGTLAIGNGGTGAGDVTNARINLLPAYTNNEGRALVVNSNATDVVFAVFPQVPVSVDNGGTGATNASGALVNLDITTTNGGILLRGSTNSGGEHVVIGTSSKATAAGKGVAIGHFAEVTGDGAAIGRDAYAGTGAAVGYGAYAETGAAVGQFSYTEGGGGAAGQGAQALNDGGAIGKSTEAYDGFAGGANAKSTADNSVQLLAGTNATENTIQFMSAGTITTNEWATLAGLSGYPTTNIQVQVVGGGTNTLVFSNGILVNVTSP